MRCMQCDTEAPNGAWNCPRCRVNLYWAHRHYQELAALRGTQLVDETRTPPFLVESSRRAFSEGRRQSAPDNKVREIARRELQEGDGPRR